jgi:hypothetical protein
MTDDANRNIADELTAIKAVADALQPLSDPARRHVIAYVAEALGIGTVPADALPTAGADLVGEPSVTSEQDLSHTAARLDIRSLREQKQPRSANEMATLVAYYVSELLPSDEQRPVVTAADIEKYFKQANFRLPGRVSQTLPDAARAGYFDAVDRGQYKLNPVGYNLVTHGMPSGGSDAPARPTRSRKPPGKRMAKKAPAKKVAKGASKRVKPAPAKRPTRKNS